AIALSVAMASPRVEFRRVRLLAIASAVAAVGLLYLAVRFTSADHYLSLTRQALTAHDLHDALHRYSQYEALQPGRTSADLWYSRALMDAAGHATDPSERIRLAVLSGQMTDRATKTAEDPFNAWFQLAMLNAAQNNREGTEHALRGAIAAR